MGDGFKWEYPWNAWIGMWEISVMSYKSGGA